MRGYVRHLRTGQLYRVVGGCLLAETGKLAIMYKSIFPTHHRETGAPLPPGTLWVREAGDFRAKFVRAVVLFPKDDT